MTPSSYEVLFAPGERVCYVRSAGPADFPSSERAIRDLAGDPRLETRIGVVVDLRAGGYTPSLEDARRLGDLIPALETLRSRPMAMVVSQSVDYGVANMISTLANLRGARVRAFMEIESALAWLETTAFTNLDH